MATLRKLAMVRGAVAGADLGGVLGVVDVADVVQRFLPVRTRSSTRAVQRWRASRNWIDPCPAPSLAGDRTGNLLLRLVSRDSCGPAVEGTCVAGRCSATGLAITLRADLSRSERGRAGDRRCAELDPGE